MPLPKKKKCCCPGEECERTCDCIGTDCFQLDGPPTWAACGSNAAALALMTAAFEGVLRKHNASSCSWWSSRCGPIGGTVIAGFAIELRLDLGACVWALEFYQACGISLVDCCNGLNDPPSSDPNVDWVLVARYTWDEGGTFSCSSGSNVFNFASDADACADCSDGGVDVTWPGTLTLNAGVTCGTEVPGGCDPGDETCCPDVWALPDATIMHCTIESDCPTFDGLEFDLTKNGDDFFRVGGNLPIDDCGTDTDCFWGSARPQLNCDTDPGCSGQPSPCWNLEWGFFCETPDFCGMNSLTPRLGAPIAVVCDPFSAIFERTTVNNFGDCDTCHPCTLTFTFTI